MLFHKFVFASFLVLMAVMGCQSADSTPPTDEILQLPTVSPVLGLDQRPLRIVATTSLIGDVVDQIGRSAIDLTVLIPPNQDSHLFEPTTADIVAMEESDFIFVNGWELEASLTKSLVGVAGKVVPISAEIVPIIGGEHDEHDEQEHGGVDPHVWFDIDNVKQWAKNVATVLASADPAHREQYENRYQSYLAELNALQKEVTTQLSVIPVAERKFVTGHEAFAYFARSQQFQLIGAVIPALTTGVEPSPRDLATLVDLMKKEQICAIFVDQSADPSLAKTVGAELKSCPSVKILPLYSESIGSGDAGSYIAIYRANVQQILDGLIR